MYLCIYICTHVYWCVIIFGSPWSVKCQTQFSRSIWTGGLPLPVNELCTREHEARHSKTLADFAVPDNTAPPPPTQTWTCLAAGTVGMILMDARWAETCPQSTHCSMATTSMPSPCLPWHFLNLMEKKITNYKSSEVPDSIFIRLNE